MEDKMAAGAFGALEIMGTFLHTAPLEPQTAMVSGLLDLCNSLRHAFPA